MRILVTGGAGQVGLELQRFAWPSGVEPHFPTRRELDLADTGAIAAAVAAQPWAAVINSAAFTGVDQAESRVAEAWTVNALAPAVLAAETAKAGIPLVHVSTDYVFSGSKPRAYLEGDRVGPLGVYGASKEGGEQGVRSGNPRHAIIRTAWVMGPQRTNFLLTILRLARERERLRVVADQLGSPTSARDLAGGLAKIALRLAEDRSAPTGTFHLANSGSASRHGLAVEILRFASAGGRGLPSVEPVSTDDLPATPARRPANSVLSCGKIAKAYGIRLPHWREAVAEIMVEVMAELAATEASPGREARAT
jgi:dTDP-4-dehydrorhamnose reductase